METGRCFNTSAPLDPDAEKVESNPMNKLHRRTFLQSSLAAGSALAYGPGLFSKAWADEAPPAKLPVAGIVTEYRENSHADVILGKILEGFAQDGGAGPALKLVSLYTDQVPESDLSRALAEKHGFRIAGSIEEALTLGTADLAVAGVLSIGEHGNYPETPDTHQVTYPRRRFFDESVAVFRRCGKTVPFFNDKHLSYRWEDARHMFDTARELGFPLMAGSSAPVTWRAPALELPLGCEIREALVLGYGPTEHYGFHALEALQCMVERRGAGETGVASVEVVQGKAIWEAEKAGRWSRQLLDATLAAVPVYRQGKVEELLNESAAFFLVEYRDGLRATVAMADGATADFAFAATLKGEEQPRVTWFRFEEDKPFRHFALLLKAIEHMLHSGQPPYPVERTLLTTGILDAAMHSIAAGQARIETPQLSVQYTPVEWPFAAGDPPQI